MSCIDWKSIKAEYIAGGTSYRKLAEKYGVSFTTLTRTAKRERWVDLRQQAGDKAATKIVEKVSEKQADIGSKILDVADKLIDALSTYIDTIGITDSQSLKHYTSALKDLKDIKGFKTDADMREQEARIAKLQKEATREEEGTKSITITIEGGEGSWQE